MCGMWLRGYINRRLRFNMRFNNRIEPGLVEHVPGLGPILSFFWIMCLIICILVNVEMFMMKQVAERSCCFFLTRGPVLVSSLICDIFLFKCYLFIIYKWKLKTNALLWDSNSCNCGRKCIVMPLNH
jgi:hypothetical protein